MDQKVQPLTPTAYKVGFIIGGIAAAAMLVFAICFYATNQKEFFFRILQITLGVLTAGFAFGSIQLFVAVARTTSRDREIIYEVSTNIIIFLIFAALTVMSVIEFVPQWHFPWILAVGFLISSFVLTVARDSLIEQGTTAILQFFLAALFSAALTWGQIALVEYLDTWIFLRLGFISIPLLGITVVLTGLTSLCCILVTVCAIVFHTLRFAYSVK